MRPEMGIDDPVAAIGDKNVAVLALAEPHCPETPLWANAMTIARWVAASPNGITSTGSGKRPRTSTHLVSSAITIMRSEAAATIFSRNSGAAALDQVERAVDLVGAVDGEIEPVDRIERGQRNVARFGLGAGRFRGRHADHLHPAGNLLAEQVDKMLGGRAGAEPELHAVLHMLQRLRRRLPLHLVHIHVPRCL